MFETSGSWLSQQRSPLESSDLRSRMIAPVNTRQHDVLPVSVNPCAVPTNRGFGDFGIPGWSEKGLANDGIGLICNSKLYDTSTLYTPNRSPLERIFPLPQVGEKPRDKEPYPEQRKFLVFDQSGNETRLMFSSLYPGVQNMPVTPAMCPIWNPPLMCAKQVDACKFLRERLVGKDEQVCIKTPIIYEESGENEILDEEREMREDTEEINALLYSDDDDDVGDDDDDYDDEDDDAVSSGRSPLAYEGVLDKQEGQQGSDFDNEVAVSNISSKRHKTIDGGYVELPLKPTLASEKIHSGDFTSHVDEGTCPIVGSKRPRKDKIRDTLKVLETILPGLNNKDPVAILDEAISYLKCLKYNAESMSAEDSDDSGCYEPLH